jgi:hypothetical protein
MTMNKAEFGDGDRNTKVRMGDGRFVRFTRTFDARARISERPSRRAQNPFHIRVVHSLSSILCPQMIAPRVNHAPLPPPPQVSLEHLRAARSRR